MNNVFEGPLASLHLDGDVLWFVRKPAAMPTIEAAREGLAAMSAAVDALPAWPRTIVLDTRAAPGRNDQDFEGSVVPMARRFAERFSRSAILVATPVGRLQAQRLGRELGWSTVVFIDEAEVVAWSHAP